MGCMNAQTRETQVRKHVGRGRHLRPYAIQEFRGVDPDVSGWFSTARRMDGWIRDRATVCEDGHTSTIRATYDQAVLTVTPSALATVVMSRG